MSLLVLVVLWQIAERVTSSITGNSLEQIGHRSWDTSFFNGGTEGEEERAGEGEEMGTV